MSQQTLAAEGAAFAAAAADIAMFAPRHRTVGTFSGGRLRLDDGADAIDLAGLDYLALGSEPLVKQLLAQALLSHDCGIPGSEAVIQTRQSYELEQALGNFHFGHGTALTFSSGYAANFAVMEALGLRTNSHFIRMHRENMPAQPTATAPTVFFLDSELHFSARHGARFARKLDSQGCLTHGYRADDLDSLDELLATSRASTGADAVRVIVTDTIESATGREFDLGALCQLAERHDCLVYADEAHAVGVVGPGGRGVTADLPDFDRYRDRLLIMGTLTKAFCQPGGYVALTDPAVAALLRFCSPQHVFSAPIAPWTAAATAKLLGLVAGAFGDQRRQRLRVLGDQLRVAFAERGFELVADSTTPILAIALKVPELADDVLSYLARSGFLVSIFQAPLRPIGQEVVRIGLRADLTDTDAERLVQAVDNCRDKLRFC